MEILSVSLKNFKSHSDRHFTFQPGTNAISGENGAGKTSILEAIAWALFNYKGAYKNEDLIRNGAASAQVHVAFVSSRDQRTYEITRCTRSGYTIYDPQIGEKLDYSRIEEEVIPWLRQQFGVAPGTDLADLFANTIGVPQGLFTADFLKPDRERKKTFDTILKVDEYRKVFEDLLPLNRYAEAAVKELDQEIARYDDDLAGFDALLQKRQAQTQEIERVRADLEQLQAKLQQLQAEQEELSAQAAQVQQLDQQIDRLSSQIQTQTQILERLQGDLQQVEQAVAICTTNRDAYQAFQQAETTLHELEQQRIVEQKLQQQQRQAEKQLHDRQSRLTTLTLQLEEIATATVELERLQPLVQQQQQLEQAQQALVQQLQACLNWRQAAKRLEKQQVQVQTRHAQVSQEIARIQAIEPSVRQIPTLEQQQQRCQQQISRLAAAAQFEADLQQLLAQAQTQGDHYLNQVQQTTAILKDLQQTAPLWADSLALALTTLQTGADWQQLLMASLEEILDDLAEQTSAAKLEHQLQVVQAQLQIARQHQLEFSNLDRLLQRQQELEQEAAELQANLAESQAQLAEEPSLQAQQQQLADQLAKLDDPRGHSRLLQQKLQQQPKLQATMQEMQASLLEIQQMIVQIDTQLADFASLPEQMQAQQTIREQHREAYQEYLAYRELANTRRERYRQFQETTTQLQTLEQEATLLSEQRDRLNRSFDPAHFQAIQSAYQTVKEQGIALNASLPDKLKYLDELEQQVAKLQILQEKRALAKAALEHKRKTLRFVKFARQAYKEAGPRITERYVQTISHEADKLFRELLNRPNVGLEWSRDYEILVQEGAHTRRFINLSGGEQMCAALAVRLALLKVLADIDIAFFDEPTTNMDRPRRESLAEAIANIKTFRQLFVISHDDTFEKVTENIILVQREIQ